MTTITQVALSALVLSPQNARKRHNKTGIESLAASLAAHGQINPLLVKPNGKAGTYQVEGGSRRLAALQLLRERGTLPADHPVDCIRIDDNKASEIGLADNVQREDLHPAEAVRAFAELAAGGLKAGEIAARFGTPTRRVKQLLALGSLSPLILDAWLDGQLGRDALDTARAFTLAASQKEQVEIFKRLKKGGALYPHNVKRALGLEDRDLSRLFTFAGAEYETAGGKVIRDLFGKDHRVASPDLLVKAANDKLAAEAAKLVEAGWSWAAPEHTLEGYRRYGGGDYGQLPWREGSRPTKAEAKRIAELEKIVEGGEDADELTEEEIAADRALDELRAAIEARGYSDADKKKSGCVLRVDFQGGIDIDYGVTKEAKAKAKAAAGETPKAKAKPVVSGALMHRVSTWATEAARTAIVEEPQLGLAALVAGIRTADHCSPIKVRFGERVWNPDQKGNAGIYYRRDARKEQFAAELRKLRELTPAELVAEAARACASALDVQIMNSKGDGPFTDGYNLALANAIDGKRLNKALRDRFDAADYFKSVSSPLIKAALAEALGPKYSDLGNMNRTKAELVELAVKLVPATGWLPKELRTVHYDGPGAAKPKASPKKAPAKKPGAKKVAKRRA